MALPQRAEISDCLWVLSYPGTARKKRLCTVLSRYPLENKPVYDHDCEDKHHSVCEPFQQKRAKGRFSHPRRATLIVYLVLALCSFPRNAVNPITQSPKKQKIRGVSFAGS